MNPDIAYIIAHPGKYAASLHLVDPGALYFMLEVTDDGTIYQLDQQDNRDGVLTPEDFHPAVRCYVTNEDYTLFVRVPSQIRKGTL